MSVADSVDVTVIIPVRNEARFIEACLTSTLSGLDHAGMRAEVLVVDGASTDRTAELVNAARARDPRVRLLDNPGRTAPIALNIGIAAARGSVIIRLDGHALYPLEYFAECVKSLEATGAENVGGLFITSARSDGAMARALAATTSLPIGVGRGFRTAAPSGYADTVPFGCFRRESFQKFGLFDERLIRGQDYEFNRRLARQGGRIWRDDAIRVGYFQLDSLRAFLRKQLLLQGPGVATMWCLAPWSITFRHLMPPLLVLSAGVLGWLSLHHALAGIVLAICAALYEGAVCVSAIGQAREIGWRAALLLPVTVTLYHFSYGLGILAGLAMMPFRLLQWARWRRPWAGATSFSALRSSIQQ